MSCITQQGRRQKSSAIPSDWKGGVPLGHSPFLWNPGILVLNTHVPPFLRQVLGLKHLLKAPDTLGFSDPLLVKLMVPVLLQVATKAVAMGTKVTLAVPTGRAVDKSQRAQSVWGRPTTAHRGVCSGQWHSEQPGEPLGAQVLPGGCWMNTSHEDPHDHYRALLPENNIVMGVN